MSSAAVVFVAHRAVWLADKSLTRVGDVVDSVAEAAVTVVDAAAFAGAENCGLVDQSLGARNLSVGLRRGLVLGSQTQAQVVWAGARGQRVQRS